MQYFEPATYLQSLNLDLVTAAFVTMNQTWGYIQNAICTAGTVVDENFNVDSVVDSN